MYFSVKTQEAGNVRERGQRERSGPITIRYLKGEGFFYSPAVSKRYGSAPERNRIKRIIRETMRDRGKSCPDGRYLVYYLASCRNVERSVLELHIGIIVDRLQSNMTI